MVRLHPINSGEIRLKGMGPRPPRRGPAKLQRALLGSIPRRPEWFPVPVFVVEHPDAGPMLIDAGYDPSVADDPVRTLGLMFGKIAMKHRLDTPSAAEQVRARGVDPAAIETVVMTHLHLDHVSGADEWPGATFLVDRVERARAMRRLPGPYVRKHLETIESWREVDFDRDGKPFEAFSRTIDLLGDGSVRLVSTPGHSPGHLSVLLRLRDRFALILGDAMISTVELRERVIDGLIMDQEAQLRSGDEIRAFVRAHPDTLAIASHDRELIPQLEPTYE